MTIDLFTSLHAQTSRDNLAAILDRVRELIATLDADLAKAEPQHFSISLMRGRMKQLLAVLEGADQ